jgi:hypothetical protein
MLVHPFSMTGSQARPVLPVGEADVPRPTNGLERVLEMGRGRELRPSVEECRALELPEEESSFERHLCCKILLKKILRIRYFFVLYQLFIEIFSFSQIRSSLYCTT